MNNQHEWSDVQSAHNAAHNAPLAIIGMACRFPGGAEDPEAFWQLLSQGRITVSEVPAERWDVRRYYSADPERPGRTYVRHGNFLEQDIRRFDAAFFGITPGKRKSWTPSSGCCSKWPGKPSNMPAPI